MSAPAGAASSPPAFSRPFEVDAQPDYPVDIEIRANEEECAALALQMAIPAVAALSARLRVARAGGRYEVYGKLQARVTQICVVSLDPFDADVRENVEATFAPPTRSSRPAIQFRPTSRRNAAPPPEREVKVDPDEEAFDPVVDGKIDLGGLVAEFLALGLDPYPRKPGVSFAPTVDQDPPPPSPFAVLGRLKKPDPGK